MATLKPIRSKPTTKPATKVAAKPAPAPAEVAPAKRKQKLIRDSFTIPKDEYVILEVLKQRALGAGRAAKKSEILRAGITVLNAMSDSVLLAALSVVPSLKTGRPKEDKAPAARKSAKKS